MRDIVRTLGAAAFGTGGTFAPLWTADRWLTVGQCAGPPCTLQTRGSNADSQQALSSLDRLEGIAAGLLLPGHGAPWRGGVMTAVDSARAIGCR